MSALRLRQHMRKVLRPDPLRNLLMFQRVYAPVCALSPLTPILTPMLTPIAKQDTQTASHAIWPHLRQVM